MRRKLINPFFIPPKRMTPDNDAIELMCITDNESSSGDDSEEEASSPQFSYAIAYASIPLLAARKEFLESWNEAPKIEEHDDFETRMGKRCDKANNCIAAPFLFIPAGCISIFSFFGGAIRDTYEVIKCKVSHHTDVVDNHDFNL